MTKATVAQTAKRVEPEEARERLRAHVDSIARMRKDQAKILGVVPGQLTAVLCGNAPLTRDMAARIGLRRILRKVKTPSTTTTKVSHYVEIEGGARP